MSTKIISAFPGTGKTHFKDSKDGTDVVVTDSDSSGFSWMPNEGGKVRNPDFPANYIEHIKSLIGKTDYILVSSHKDVRDALVKAGLGFTLVYPSVFSKQDYLHRYEQRGNPLSFILLVEKHWEEWIEEIENQVGCNLLLLQEGQFLSDVIEFI